MKEIKAKDIMNREVIAVAPETTVEELGRLFIEKDVSGVPVIAEDGSLYGVVTTNDLIHLETSFHIPTVIRIFDAFIPMESELHFKHEIAKMAASTVKDICTRDITTVTEEASIHEIADIMAEKKIHHLPVLKGGQLVGTIGEKDIIKAISKMRWKDVKNA
ncbi:MAG: CBS domain-containing protein [Nitrospirae bacterium]|nr:CBS domain-containing protein [Nitrospirota bacterium]